MVVLCLAQLFFDMNFSMPSVVAQLSAKQVVMGLPSLVSFYGIVLRLFVTGSTDDCPIMVNNDSRRRR